MGRLDISGGSGGGCDNLPRIESVKPPLSTPRLDKTGRGHAKRQLVFISPDRNRRKVNRFAPDFSPATCVCDPKPQTKNADICDFKNSGERCEQLQNSTPWGLSICAMSQEGGGGSGGNRKWKCYSNICIQSRKFDFHFGIQIRSNFNCIFFVMDTK